MSNFEKNFWGTVGGFLIITVILIVMASFNTADEQLKEARNQTVLSDQLKAWGNIIVNKSFAGLNQIPFSHDFKEQISRQVDLTFQPVYQNIPSFAEAHYSVLGEYTELTVAATGKLSDHIQSTLFKGFDSRQISQHIAPQLSKELQNMVENRAKQSLEQVQIPSGQQEALNQLVQQEVQKYMISWEKGTGLVATGVLGAVGGSAAIKLIAATIARKMIMKLGLKLAGKTAIKSGGAGALAAAGAALGSVVPGIGTAIGGVIGGAIGWVATDAVFVSVDEWMSRDEFEADLREQITQQKNQIKQQLFRYVDGVKQQLSAHAEQEINGKAPAKLNQ